ncbi:hypothetical protein [Paenibacillus naphthalenovorans]|uniref:Uncharacterized protein n=1 Tax=Paenibacillus naphthalenovorans TaxID=162209 RepID=A0A0U2WID9_9BACL|nr:hypothetical protein [Paenibacillus naphthalenovorans]ALS25066.1 hypothetical protein IJ22_48040 [Paenibacillus naphthalenovorans]GCL74783.1 hypothetical protein PN4B1_47650 [Paenibacillus naphthalenovorans]
MKDFPDWLQEALRARFDEQALHSLQLPPIKNLREQAKVSSEQFRRKISEANRAEFLLWEEECNYLHAQELEWLYMQGVKDGAQILFSLLCSQYKGYGLPATMATCGNEELSG